MSLCENHPNQLATGKCSVCGRHVCGICSTTNDGAITCFSCDERTEWVQSGSPWDRAQSPWETGAIMDTRTKNYLLLGAIGSVLWLFILLASAIQYWMIIVGSYTNPMIYVLSIPVSIISLVQPILLGLGFLGFYYKYDHKPSRYVLFLGIAIILINLLFNVLLGSLPIEALVYSPIYSFILIATVYASAAIPLLYYVLVLYCLVTLRKGLRRPVVASIAILCFLLYIPYIFMYAIFFPLFLPLFYLTSYLIGQAIVMVISVCLAILFFIEGRDSPISTIKQWK